MGNTIFGNFAQKSQNYYFQLKFATNINSNISNSIVVLTFSALNGKHPFYSNLMRNKKFVNLNWNFLIRLTKNLNMQNPVVVFTFSFPLVFFLFFGQTFFVPNAEFSGGVHFFCFKMEALFLFKFGSKIQHCQFKWKFGC